MKSLNLFVSLACAASLSACSVNSSRDHQADKIQFLAFGDSGYHYDYLKPKLQKNPQTPAKFQAAKLKKWLKQYRPKKDFIAPPMYLLPGGQFAVERTGLHATAKAMTRFCQQAVCEFGIMLGDNIYPDGADGKNDDERFYKIFEQPYKSLGAGVEDFKLYAALGNHDWNTSRLGRNAQVDYAQRHDTKITMQQPGYFTFKRQQGELTAEFFVLDTNLLLKGQNVLDDQLNPDGSPKQHTELNQPESWEKPTKADSRQLQWLDDQLAASDADWKIVMGHHTIWSSGGSKFEEAKVLRRLLLPSLCEYADMYFAGHEHDLEVHLDTCQGEQGEGATSLPLIISGAAAKQRAIHTTFQQWQKANNPTYRELWLKGMVWGFSHIQLDKTNARVDMFTTPNDESGKVVHEVSFNFGNR